MNLLKNTTRMLGVLWLFLSMGTPIFADILLDAETNPTLLEAVISSEDTVAVQKSSILDASQSFLPNPEADYTYEWDFGDGNKDEGVEVLHVYKDPGQYTVSLKVSNDTEEASVEKELYVYKKMILLLTDAEQDQIFIENAKSYAQQEGVFLSILDSFGSASELISEEILSKKLIEARHDVQKALQIVVWTKGNTGINALTRFLQETKETFPINFSQKSITVLTSDISGFSNRIKRQFQTISPKSIILTNDPAIHLLIDNFTSTDFITTLESKGYEHEIITNSSYKLRPWNFMSYFLTTLIDRGIPDSVIALLLLLPIIATVVAFMKQIVGLTTMGIYTPIIMTLSFLTIGLYFGLLTLISVLVIGGLTRHLLRNVRLLFIPKMAIVMTLVSLGLILILITTVYLDIFNATFFSLAIFPMVILSTLVEKFVSIKTEKGFISAVTLMSETLIVAIIAYIVAGGEVDLGFAIIKVNFVSNLMLSYPEIIFLLLGINILLGRWSGLTLLEIIRFREILRHIEE
mgnify:FL=1